MKYYRMKNPNWDGHRPQHQWRIAVTIEQGGEEHFVTLEAKNGQRHVETQPVKDTVMVPAKFQLDSNEFHLVRRYIECLGVDAMEEVTEEQVKAEETIDMNSGFNWLSEDRKESLRHDKESGGSANSSPNSSNGSHGNSFSLPKSNIFGTGRDIGTFTSRTPTLGPPIGQGKSLGYDSNGNIKSAEEILKELQEVQASFGHVPSFAIQPDGEVEINIGGVKTRLKHDELVQKLSPGRK